MTLAELARLLDLEPLGPTTGAAGPQDTTAPSPEAASDITRAYASDLLSDVLANAPAGGVLITLQVHLNVIAVASHAGLRAVIFSCGRVPDQEVADKAAEEGLALYVSQADTFDIAGRLYAAGIRGSA